MFSKMSDPMVAPLYVQYEHYQLICEHLKIYTHIHFVSKWIRREIMFKRDPHLKPFFQHWNS